MKSTGDIVIFVDDDVVVGPHFVEQHVSTYADSSVSGVTGSSVFPRPATDRWSNWNCSSLRRASPRHSSATGTRAGFEVSSGFRAVTCRSGVRRLQRPERSTSSLPPGPVAKTWTCRAVSGSLATRLIVDTRIELIHLAMAEGGCELRVRYRQRTQAGDIYSSWPVIAGSKTAGCLD